MKKKTRLENISIDETANALFGKLPEKESQACENTKQAVLDVLRANPDLAPER